MAPGEKPRRVTDDRFAALIRLFMQSSKWMNPPPIGYTDGTKKNWRRELEFMARPSCLGAVSLDEIRPSLVQAFFDGIADRPGKQEAALAAVRQLEKWAMVREHLSRPITLGVEIEGSDGGHIPWDDEHVALAVRETPWHISRIITLAANTGQRGSDLIRMCPTDIEIYKGLRGIVVTQQKTGRQVWVPITSDLDAAMSTWERRPGPFLTRADGRPWTRVLLSVTWGYYRDTLPALAPLRLAALATQPGVTSPRKDRGLVIHGLRATACVRLRRAGATELQISDMVGMSPQMVKRYCRGSVQRENASAAVEHLRTFAERLAAKTSKNGS